MKKILIILPVLMLIFINLISAINLDVDIKTIQRNVILDLNEPAVFEITIKNLGEADNFKVYSLVGINIFPETEFSVSSEETKTIEIQAFPQESVILKKGPFPFEYKIKNSQNEVQTEQLTINIIELKDAFSIFPGNINPDSEQTTLTIENKINYNFKEIKIKSDSVFFSFEETFSLEAQKQKKFSIPLNIEKVKTSMAGSYLLNSKIQIKEVSTNIESIIKFMEQEGVETEEVREGFFIRRTEKTRINVGNTVKEIKISEQKNIFSYLFTTFNIAPTKIQRQGLKINYIWEKELIPNEEIKIIIKTNWFYPFIIIIFAIALFLLIKRYVESDLILRKKVSFVKTRGGEFALKITLNARAKDFIERINIIDKLPPLVKLYEKYGTTPPDKVDLDNKRLEWNIESMNKDEKRIFSYIIYSKIGVVGRFELPCARAIYEKQGKIKKIESNRSFFINEPKK